MSIVLIAPIVALVVLKVYLKATTGMCHANDSLCGKVVIVTGANTGIGFETAKDLARRGARVILACRNTIKGQLAAQEITRATGNHNIIVKCLDLSSFASIKHFCREVVESENTIHILINNAGTARLDNSLTIDKLPIEMQTNHFGPFLLTNLLLPTIIASAPSRIVNVSSIMHYFGSIDLERIGKPAESSWQHAKVYSNSKLANILFTRQLHKYLDGTRVIANSVHPGAVDTELFRYHPKTIRFILGFFMKTPYEGAQTSIYCAVSPEVTQGGKYYSNCTEGWASRGARNDEMAKKLWDLSEQLTHTTSKWAKKEEPILPLPNDTINVVPDDKKEDQDKKGKSKRAKIDLPDDEAKVIEDAASKVLSKKEMDQAKKELKQAKK